MAVATTATFAGIHNENEFYSHHYLSEIFTGDIKGTVKRWQEAAGTGTATPPRAVRALAGDYTRFRDGFARQAGRRRATHQLHSNQVAEQRRWFRRFLGALGYENDWHPTNHVLDDGIELPVLCAVGRTTAGRSASGAPQLLVLDAYDAGAEGGPIRSPSNFTQRSFTARRLRCLRCWKSAGRMW